MVAKLVGGGDAQDFSDIMSGISDIVTILAIVFGAVWAYIRFVRDRTYRPRIKIDIQGEYLGSSMSSASCLVATVNLRNIGGSKLKIRQRGSGLMISQPAEDQPLPHLAPQEWNETTEVAFPIFESHDWLESDEQITHEVTLRPLLSIPSVMKLEARVVVERRLRQAIAVSAVHIVGSEDVRPIQRGDTNRRA